MNVYATSKLLEDFVKVAKLAGVPMKPVLTLIYWGGGVKIQPAPTMVGTRALKFTVDLVMHVHYHTASCLLITPSHLTSLPIMPNELAVESSLTDRYQTTVPELVRLALGLGKRDKLQYTIVDGSVVVTRVATAVEEDPVLGKFLRFLEKDIDKRPDSLQPLEPALVQRAGKLVRGVKVDLNAPLPKDD